MLDLNMIEVVAQGGKTDGSRGARKELIRRAARSSDGDNSLDRDPDFDQEDVYYERW